MLKVFMIMSTILLEIIAVAIIIKKRQQMQENKGWKSFVTPVCFLLAPVVALIAYLFNAAGTVSWACLLGLFITAAYFTKHLPSQKNHVHM
ncbi:hypothetical protein MUN89_12755 [Halobacillus salinarum]|uniref:Amino acid permease n=1 Tax=Halobacillus salinarum TaxID=2932257 RepID=A0ABY4EED6_9BACI|nr:hypothetical protein [Halobacillus salinarum]UOQ42831.1 hypothetical protein MUN89_12755 [Halobacillus salinarum]